MATKRIEAASDGKVGDGLIWPTLTKVRGTMNIPYGKENEVFSLRAQIEIYR